MITAGNHRILLHGYIALGPNPGYVVSLIFGLLCFGWFVVSNFGAQWNVFYKFAFGVLLLLDVVLAGRVGLSDPGIVPTSHSPHPPASTSPIEEQVNGVKIERKWCYTCNMYRPLRSKHCGLCNCCIDRFDHHCVWLSNCVGSRNYRTFFSFLIALFFTSLVIFVFLVGSSSAHWLSTVILQLVALAGVLVSGNMIYYHVGLIARGATSYEHEQKLPGQYPFSLGSWHANLADFFSSTTAPSQFTGWTAPRDLDEEELAGLSGAEFHDME